MEPEWNCSSQCDSPLCFSGSGVHRPESLEVLQRLCRLGSTAAEVPRRSLSPVLSAVVWTLLSCGILVAFCFFLFTVRFKNNRIVKMSSPNLNILTLCGSLLTYSSGFLFAFEARAQGGSPTVVLQARVWTLCLGSTLVFAPIVGKTWRLYRVFTQRLPDKRVIIRDIQLMGLVALLILTDLLILTAWNLSDPVRCSRTLGATVKLVEKDTSFSMTQQDTCSSSYSHLWIMIIAMKKGCLLLYGTYLAGLTSNVSHPPVNQSPTIITAATLVAVCSTVAVPVSVFLAAWPNLVYSTVAGAIFICTLATNCMLFVPQLTEWRQFEEDQNNPSQMAKYFSSPSKSQTSAYSQDEIYFLLGENNSMKKLLSEKNAVIDSLQEQVNNAKDKLLLLVSASQPSRDQDATSSAANLNSSSTQTTELQPCSPTSPLPQREQRLSPALLSSPLTAAAEPLQACATSSAPDHGCPDEDLRAPGSLVPPGFLRTPQETADFVTSLQSQKLLSPAEVVSFCNGPTSPPAPNSRLAGFVSSEKLQEVLQELSMDAVMESALRSLSQTSRRPSESLASPRSLLSPRSPNPPVLFRYPSISPYAMRKRRPPFHSPRRGMTPPCFYAGPDSATCGRTSHCEKSEEVDLLDQNLEEQRNVGGDERIPNRNPPLCHSPPPEVGVEAEPPRIRDPCRYWDSDSSSSTDFCFYHRPYCDSCLQRGSLLTSDSSSDSSDSEYEGFSLYRSQHPVVFKEDLKPTFV
ncbi:probable G-protein coupled receptor 156 isoform X1 [Synchiropus splendidus]|uniref:probable G-protein coupled receptor 156 isoform X1 n=2 Tax=Synchiropus splendidus TaxID=270530 RepID=UPI00237EC05C|nr:probable G-protein coupled receptor 156 isoform X1 [Synchiropus splendidus]